MHFSLITPTPGRERDAAHEWTHGAYQEHQWLWRFLPAPPGTPRSFLFRRRDVEGLPRFYVVSDRAPVAPSPHWQVQSRPYAPDLVSGEWLAFELRANPVVTTRNATGKAARHDVVMQEKTRLLKERQLARWADWPAPDRPAMPELVQRTCGAWLQARCERLGITLDKAALSVEGYEQHRGKNGALRISTVDFSGILRVVDASALRLALYDGIGHAKAFGCGLLLIRRIS
ncbi:MAG: type I-E CRISPR-associated protein Cas6/Cse3/CasE [Rubrivivax sp.]|nr:type I-E CRISPR-associated protein Cas6/Cse3/CasE [Rubrivivax sp.]